MAKIKIPKTKPKGALPSSASKPSALSQAEEMAVRDRLESEVAELMDIPPFTTSDRAAAGRAAAELIKSQPQSKLSEAIGNLNIEGYGKLSTTQADRTRVGGGNIGGAAFPAISEAHPSYEGKVWGVMDSGTASRLTNLTSPDVIWTTMLGSANQLKTNPIVFSKLEKEFRQKMKAGLLSPELESKINQNLRLILGEGADIRDPKIWKDIDTFEKRAMMADLMMGQGLPPQKGGVSLGGEKSGKGVIFKPTETLIRETEPSLLHTEHGGNVPTFALGPRLFSMEKEYSYRPDLHPGFPTLIHGKDLGYNVTPVPNEIALPDWHARFKEMVGGKRKPGYYDLALGIKGEGLPSQLIDHDYLMRLSREGYREGGMVDQALVDKVNAPAAKAMLEMDLARLAVAKDKMQPKKMAKGGKLPKNVLPAAKRAENLERMLMESKIKERLYHVTPKNFSEFNKPGEVGASSGDATWMSPDPDYLPAAHNVRARGAEYREGTNVMPLHIESKNPLILDDKTMLDWARATFADDSGVFPMTMNPEWAKSIKDAGYDSIKYSYPVNGEIKTEVIGLYPEKIKSAIGNVGTYDTSNPDITKAKGGRIKAPKVNAPAVVPRSTLTELQNFVREREGGYGAARLERAADEIKNLEKLYTQDALRQAFTGDNASALMTMNPADFEKFATPIPPIDKSFDPSGGVINKFSVTTDDYIKHLAEVYAKGGFSDVPFLEINKTEQGLPLTPFISGHEGRHRNRAMAGAGEEAGLVRLLPRAELREPFPRRYREDYIEALKKELEMTGNKVQPQTWREADPNSFNDIVIRRPEIDLPDIYAKGGRVTFPSVEEMRIEIMERKNAKN